MAVGATGSTPAAAATAMSFVGAPLPVPVVSASTATGAAAAAGSGAGAAGAAAAGAEAAAGAGAGAGEGVEASLASSALSANALNAQQKDLYQFLVSYHETKRRNASPPTLGFSPRPSCPSRPSQTRGSSQTRGRGRGRVGSGTREKTVFIGRFVPCLDEVYARGEGVYVVCDDGYVWSVQSHVLD